jgi:hypothetical protein
MRSSQELGRSKSNDNEFPFEKRFGVSQLTSSRGCAGYVVQPSRCSTGRGRRPPRLRETRMEGDAVAVAAEDMDEVRQVLVGPRMG